MPASRKVRTVESWSTTRIVCPTWSLCSAAVSLSTTASSGPFGPVPATMFPGYSAGSAGKATALPVRPSVRIAWPFASSSGAGPLTWPLTTASEPTRAWIWSTTDGVSTDGGVGGAVVLA